jgi:hypothetical protein
MTYLLAIAIIFLLFAGWVGVQHLARAFAARHPELGPAREEGSGCGFFCLCKDPEACPKRALQKKKDKNDPIPFPGKN